MRDDFCLSAKLWRGERTTGGEIGEKNRESSATARAIFSQVWRTGRYSRLVAKCGASDHPPVSILMVILALRGVFFVFSSLPKAFILKTDFVVLTQLIRNDIRLDIDTKELFQQLLPNLLVFSK